MRRARLILLLLFLLVASLPATAATAASVTQAGAAQKTSGAQKNSRVQTVQFESKLVGKALPYSVVLPVDYDQPSTKTTRYPVLYLLHGLTGHYSNWTTYTRLSDYAAQYPMIIVTPEGNNGWYTDSATVATDKYETYILEELIPDVERRYRTNVTRAGRAIAGLSMGGYGALKFGVKHPQAFAFAGSLSGALAAASWTESDLRGFDAIRRSLLLIFGPDDAPMRPANDLHKLYGELTPERIAALPYVYLDCGTEDPLLPTNRSLVEILLARKIPHEYRQLPGKHNWQYWDAQIQEVLKLAAQKTRRL